MLKINFLQAGYCTHPEATVLRGQPWKKRVFPSLVAVIEHPVAGFLLFDTGYSHRFFQETRAFPFQLYAALTPVYFQEKESAVFQLQERGLEAEQIKFVIISHFHADHIGGLKDFPQAKFCCFQSAYEAVKDKQGISALRAGFLAGMIPANFEELTVFVEHQPRVSLPPEYSPFETGFDVLGDGSILAVELPGHVLGQLGIFLTDTTNQTYFLIADACWLSRAYQELIAPHPIVNLLLADRKAYQETLQKIHQLYQSNPQIKIVPAHCLETWQELKNKA